MFENVLVSEQMTSPAISVSPDLSIRIARQMMRDYGIRRLPVVEHSHLIGIITLGDIRHASPADDTSRKIWDMYDIWARITVRQVMVRQVVCVHNHAPLLDAVSLMLQHKVGGLPVLDEQNDLVGMITRSDVFHMFIDRQQKTHASLLSSEAAAVS